MSKCKECVSEQVCRYNDGVNLYCKEDYECPHFKNKAGVIKCEDCLYVNVPREKVIGNATDCDHFKDKADFVQVVRCKNCVNYCGFEHCENGICDVDPVNKRAVFPTHFCSYGERRDT